MKKAVKQLLTEQGLLATLNRAQTLFITDAESRGVFESLLDELLKITRSEYGFIARVLYDENKQPYIKTLAITNIAWNEEMRTYHDRHVAEGLELRNISSLFGQVLTSGEPLIANDAPNDPRGSGVPHGHPPLNAFLGIPIHVGSDLIGMLGIANCPEGYTQQTIDFLAPLTAVCAQLIYAYEAAKQRKQAEEALRESERQLLDAQRISHVGSWHLDTASNQVTWSEELYKMYGFDPTQPVPPYTESQKLFTPESWALLNRSIQCVLDTGSPYEIELEMVRISGHKGWMLARGEPVKDASGAVVGIRGVAQDITEQKESEAALLEAQRNYEEAEHLAHLGHWQLDLVSNELKWSKEIFSIFGIDPEKFDASYEMFLEAIHPDDRDLVSQSYEASVNNRTDYNIEHRLLMSDGSIKWVIERGKTSYSDEGEPLVSTGTVQDITESKQQHELLEASRKRFQTLFDSSTDGIFILDMHGDFIDINRTAHKRLGYSKAEMLALNLSTLDTPEFAEKVPMRMQQVIRNGSAVFESAQYRKDGSIMPTEVNARLLELEGEQIILSIIRDISERKALEAQIRQSQKMESIGTLVGGIAHDFNNMLPAVQGNVYMAKKQLQGHPEATGRLENIEKLGNRAASMVQQLLTFARQDTVQMSVFILNDFMKEGYSLAKAAIPESIDHKSVVCEEPLQIKGDATQLQQVLFNLLSNAVDAVADSRRPEIRCSLHPFTADAAFLSRHSDLEGESFACITVSDNGHGIPSEWLDKIFEPFFTTKEVGKGTGLGLAMLYGAVQTHSGVVEVESDQDHGTSFKIYLPLSNENPEEPSLENVSRKGGQGETILLVDDEDNLRETTAEVLFEMGYKVFQATNGVEALEMFKSRQSEIDLILSDVVMPQMGGIKLLHSIREFDQQVPILLATGYDKDEVLDRDDLKQNCQVIHKPFDFNELSRMIRSMIR